MRWHVAQARLWLLAALLILALLPAHAREPESRKSGIVIEGLSVVQQTTDYTCGPAVAVGIARFFGIAADEMTAAREIGTTTKRGTTPRQLARWLKLKGLKVTRGENGSIALLKANLARGVPTLVEWTDWGGHWVVVVGIDDKGTPNTDDDDIIFADPWDRIDGVSDGYTRFNLERFESMWFDALLFGRTMKKVYITVEKGQPPAAPRSAGASGVK